MSAPVAPTMKDYAMSFFWGGVTGAVFYYAIDSLDGYAGNMVPEGWPTAFVASGVGAIVGPMITARMQGMM